jgi:hypothetical protein
VEQVEVQVVDPPVRDFERGYIRERRTNEDKERTRNKLETYEQCIRALVADNDDNMNVGFMAHSALLQNDPHAYGREFSLRYEVDREEKTVRMAGAMFT